MVDACDACRQAAIADKEAAVRAAELLTAKAREQQVQLEVRACKPQHGRVGAQRSRVGRGKAVQCG